MRRRAISPGRPASLRLGLTAGLAVAAAVGLLAGCGLLAGSSGGHPAGDGGTAEGATRGSGPPSHRAAGGKGQPGPAAAVGSGAVTSSAVGDMMLGNMPDLPPDPHAYRAAVEPALHSGP